MKRAWVSCIPLPILYPTAYFVSHWYCRGYQVSILDIEKKKKHTTVGVFSLRGREGWV
jgi:hypothetical protein